jgi:SAM-dependent methyltransferase
LNVLDIGCGSHRDSRATAGMDFYPYPGVTIVHDVTNLPWPVPDASFEGAVSHQLIEHLPHKVSVAGNDVFFEFFDEVWRILKPGGTFSFDVPDPRGQEAYGDPTHRRLLSTQAFDHLWKPGRDSLYPRKSWQLVDARNDYWFGGSSSFNTWHLQKHLPMVDRIFQKLHVGTPKNIYITVRKPG